MLAVNLAEPESRIRRFLDTMPLRFPMLLDRDDRRPARGRRGCCRRRYVVGPDGAIRYRHLGELDWSQPRSPQADPDACSSESPRSSALALRVRPAPPRHGDEWQPPFITTPAEVVRARCWQIARDARRRPGGRPRLGRRPHRHRRGAEIRRARPGHRARRRAGREVAQATPQRARGRRRASSCRATCSPPTSRGEVVTVYLLPALMEKLQPRFIDQLAPGTRIVSHAFTMAGWAPDRSETVRISATPSRPGRREPRAPVDRAGERARRVARLRRCRCASSRTTRRSTSKALSRATLSGRDIAWEIGGARFSGTGARAIASTGEMFAWARAARLALDALEHLPGVHQPLGSSARLSARISSSSSGDLCADRLALELPDAVLGRDRAAERADRVVDHAVHRVALRSEQRRGADVVVQVAVAEVAEAVDLGAGNAGFERRARRAR